MTGANTTGDYGNMLYEQQIVTTKATSTSSVPYATDGGTKILASPLYLARSGSVNGGSLSNLGSYGYYWSSSVCSSSYAYYLHLDSSDVYPQVDYYRASGRSVRCVSE